MMEAPRPARGAITVNATDASVGHTSERELAARLAAIVASADDAIVSKTLDGIITSWNRAAEALFGYTAAEAIGRSITMIIPPERLHEETEVLARLRRGEAIEHFETERVTRDGRIVPISLSVSPVRDADGRIIGAAKIARDISERRRAEARIAQTLQTLETLYRLADRVGRAKALGDVCDAALDAIMAVGPQRASVLLFDAAGVLRFQGWRNLSDRYRAAVEGHSPWSRDAIEPAPIVIEDVMAGPSMAPLRDVVVAEGIRALAFVPLVHHAELIGKFMTYYDAPHAYSAEELRLATTIAQHIAFGVARIRAETAMEDALAAERAARQDAEAAHAEADTANRAKDQFLAVLSHELRTPLNAILGWVRLLQGAPLPEGERLRALEVVERNARLQAQLVADLLDVSRVAAGKIEIERVPVDFAAVTRAAIEAMADDVTTKRLDLVTALDEVGVIGDPGRLQQAVSNVLANAVKFTPEGGRIEVRLSSDGERARLTVADTGEGIDPALLSRIFEPFEQADRSTTRRHGGLGLGLAIVRQLVVLHGGSIRAESAGKGRGARFTIELPAAGR